MPRASKTGVRGLFRDKTGQLWIDLRWKDPRDGTQKRYRERIPRHVTMAAAKRRAAEILSAALAGTFDPKRKPPKRFRAAFDAYLEWLKTERPRAEADRRLHGKALVASIGDVELDALTPLAIERFKRERRDAGSAPATVNRHLATLKHFVRTVRDWAWMSTAVASSVRAVRLLREPPGRVRYLTPDEEKKLFAALSPDLGIIALAASLSGMRRAEVVSLRWGQVDLANRSITLTRTKSNRVRRIPIHPALADLLEGLPGASGPTEWVFPLPTRVGSTGALRPDEQRRKHYVTKAFSKAAKDAGIPDLRFHDLRHDFATRLRRSGAGIDAIAKLLGHSTLAMAARYAHLDDPTLRQTVRALIPPGSEAEAEAEVISLQERRSTSDEK